ncbi:MAG: signal transduction histidine kinase [Flavobacteriales bacterium]|jgi:signal transduction histidine kinase
MIANFLRSLQGRLSITIAVIFFLFGGLSFGLMVFSSRVYEKEVSQLMHKDLAQHVAGHYILFDKNGEPDLAQAKHTFHDLMILGPNFEFYVLDTAGKILTYSADPSVVKRKTVNTQDFDNWENEIERRGIVLGDDPRNTGQQKVYSVAPIIQDGIHHGYLYVVVGSQIREALEAELSSSKILKWGLTLFAVAFAFTFIVMMFVLGWITRPLSKLTQQVKRVRQQGFENGDNQFKSLVEEFEIWNNADNNDIHALGDTFKRALDTLQQQYDTVVSIDDLRKEMLSHVSHDLRTPLASLLGYLETWEIQKDEISPEKAAEYIGIAKRNAQKISTLIEQLFELAHLDGANVQVNRERFSIAELTQDVLSKFKIKALEKNITLGLNPQNGLVSVNADIEKLDRVFTNLIENAMRHTPEGGRIEVKIQDNSGLVAIEVTDTGIGIPEQDLPFIFDAHFKAGNSVRENTSHGGLGLAITKKLLELHESAIQVSSRINQGTTFRFDLRSA